ncbi:Acetyltransferase [BD1-7 clade bacterium]|uniref:Acetyltransferase n=1 Tax=BD1-7 clade bacterium TaxID=2029982 RepID=A0A5S9QZR7_9GAMM|nr:Acetyltransferase [BD1-7 clade bacterium]
MTITPAIKVIHTNWQIHSEVLHKIRTAVFVEEQNIHPDLEWDEFDASATHFIVFVDDAPAGCARLKIDHDVGRIGRMAVLDAFRGAGLASLLMTDVIAYASAQSLTRLELDAQTYVRKLYENTGFSQCGDEFIEDGTDIPHIPMQMRLEPVAAV